MELEKSYKHLFNTITDEINMLDVIKKLIDERIKKLKESQCTTEEMHVSKEDT